MGMLKKLCITTALGIMVSGVSYASVVSETIVEGKLRLTYPVVYTDNKVAQTAIFNDIWSYVLKAKEDYYNGIAYEVFQGYEVTYEDDQVISILLNTGKNYKGAAHGTYSTRGLVYDKNTGQRIPLYNYVRVANAQQLEDGINEDILNFYTSASKRKTYLPKYKHIMDVTDNYYLPGNGYVKLIYQPYVLGPFNDGVTFIEFSPEAIEYFNRMNNW